MSSPSSFWRKEAFERKEVLVVNDDRFKLGVCYGLVISQNFFCRKAISAPEAWDKLIATPEEYGLVITDNSMPQQTVGADGFDYGRRDHQGLSLIRRMREHRKLRSLDAVLFTDGAGRSEATSLNAVYINQIYVLYQFLSARNLTLLQQKP